jgi:hypothetical protein
MYVIVKFETYLAAIKLLCTVGYEIIGMFMFNTQQVPCYLAGTLRVWARVRILTCYIWRVRV